MPVESWGTLRSRKALSSTHEHRMSQQDEPFSESHLESPEYRERLLRKLNRRPGSRDRESAQEPRGS